jgi:short subunit dehydrogenase-like uncharacterized protein
VHNLSLAAEIPILEQLFRVSMRPARERGVIVGVGLGFDVMPTDCLASMVKERLPDASWLVIGMDGENRMSPGSTKEFVEQVGEHPLLGPRRWPACPPLAPRTRWLDYGAGRKLSSLVSWGDVASACALHRHRQHRGVLRRVAHGLAADAGDRLAAVPDPLWRRAARAEPLRRSGW